MQYSIGRKLLSPFGVELDIDLSETLTSAQAAELLRIFREHHLIVARGQHLSSDQQQSVMSFLGPVPQDGVDMTSNDPKVGLQGSIRLAALKNRIGALDALNIWPIDQTGRNRVSSLRDSDPRCAHPVVWPHPATGEPVLYVTEMQSDSMVGLPHAESEALIAQLLSYLYASDNIVSHRWRVGDLVIWDNLALQHARNDVSQVGIRTLRRVSIARQSFFQQFPQFQPAASGFADQRMETVTAWNITA